MSVFACGSIHQCLDPKRFSDESPRGWREIYMCLCVCWLLEVRRCRSNPHSWRLFSLWAFSKNDVPGKTFSVRSKQSTLACWSREKRERGHFHFLHFIYFQTVYSALPSSSDASTYFQIETPSLFIYLFIYLFIFIHRYYSFILTNIFSEIFKKIAFYEKLDCITKLLCSILSWGFYSRKYDMDRISAKFRQILMSRFYVSSLVYIVY